MSQEPERNYEEQQFIWFEVDLDEYELPTGHMADSAAELAEQCGVRVGTIYQCMSRAKRRRHRCKYVRVPLD